MVRIARSEKTYFKNVTIRPRRSFLRSRADVDLSRTFTFEHSKGTFKGIPIVAANMDTVGTFEVAIALSQHEALTAIHKYYPVEAWQEFSNDHPECMPFVILSTGTSEAEFALMCEILDAVPSIKYVLVDTLAPGTQVFLDHLKQVRQKYPNKTLIAGSVACREVVEEMIISAGVDIIKIGMAMQSTSTTLKKTGCGYPSISNILECSDFAHGLGGRVMAFGGVCCPGDIAKAMGAGADFVMLGGLLAGHDECGGELIYKNGRKYKLFYDMTSTTAMKKHVGCVHNYRESEGRTVEVPYKGSITNTFLDLITGLRSACTYAGCSRLKELYKRCMFVPLNKGTAFMHTFQKKKH